MPSLRYSVKNSFVQAGKATGLQLTGRAVDAVDGLGCAACPERAPRIVDCLPATSETQPGQKMQVLNCGFESDQFRRGWKLPCGNRLPRVMHESDAPRAQEDLSRTAARDPGRRSYRKRRDLDGGLALVYDAMMRPRRRAPLTFYSQDTCRRASAAQASTALHYSTAQLSACERTSLAAGEEWRACCRVADVSAQKHLAPCAMAKVHRERHWQSSTLRLSLLVCLCAIPADSRIVRISPGA
eukprot:6188613-Pleurochrysis_carterae.AAC.1